MLFLPSSSHWYLTPFPWCMLLLLYPSQCFQRCLSNCRLRWHGLHIFIDSFHGCYKNGTVVGTQDCRYFAAVYLIARIILLIVYAATLGGLFDAVALLILIALAALVSIIQPYREDLAVHSNIDIVLNPYDGCMVWVYSLHCYGNPHGLYSFQGFSCSIIHHSNTTTCVSLLHCLALAVLTNDGTTETLSDVPNLEKE